MRGPAILRRLGARGFDRRMALVVFALVALVVLVAVAVARSSTPARDAERRDPKAAADLVARMKAGENARWLARYDFTRTLANGRTLTQPLTEARTAARHVLVSGSAMTVERGDLVEECNLVGAQSSCHTSTQTGAVPASAVLRVAIDSGAYDVTRQPSTTIAGVEGECFRVRSTGRGALPDVGTETDACYSASGVPLRQRVVHTTGVIDEREAQSVRTGVTADVIARLEREFAENGALGNP